MWHMLLLLWYYCYHHSWLFCCWKWSFWLLDVSRSIWFSKSKIEVKWVSETRWILYQQNTRTVSAANVSSNDALASNLNLVSHHLKSTFTLTSRQTWFGKSKIALKLNLRNNTNMSHTITTLMLPLLSLMSFLLLKIVILIA